MRINFNKTGNNKKNARGFLAAMVFIALFMIILSVSCSNTNGTTTTLIEENTENTGTENSQVPDTDKTPEGKTISIWNSAQPKDRIFLMESINNFTKINPEITVNARHFRNEEELVDVFSAASLSGAGPEIVLASFDSMKKMANENILKDLTDEMNYDIFLEGLTELSSFDSKKYIIPFSSSDFLVFYYNKDIISEVPSNFDDVIVLSKESLSGEDSRYGFVFNASEPDWTIPFVGGFFDWFYEYSSGDVNLNTSAMEKTLDFINNIYNVEKIMPANRGYEESNNLFKSGNASMIINGVWAVDEYREAQINFGISKIPRNTGAATNPTPMISGLGFMVNSNSTAESFETSKKIIDYMISAEIQTSWALNSSSYPAITGLETNMLSNNDLIYNILLQAKVCRGKPPEEELQLIRDVLRINIEGVLAGDISPADAKEKMQEDLIKLKSGEIEVQDYSAVTTDTASNGTANDNSSIENQ
ncbi:MAG: extracellular solute-binding protein [Candidatus Humimicrobiaceae bacterium]